MMPLNTVLIPLGLVGSDTREWHTRVINSVSIRITEMIAFDTE